MKKARPARAAKSLEWVGLAELYDHHLSPASPIWVNAAAPVQPAPLQVHVHRGLDVGILLMGEYELQYGDYSFSPKPGDVWLGGMWEPHAWRVIQPDSLAVQVCFLPEVIEEQPERELELLRMFTVPASQRPRVTTPLLRQEALEIARRLKAEINARPPGWRTVVRVELIHLLVLLNREWTPPRSSARRPAVRANDLARIVPGLALVHSNPGARILPRDAAHACQLSLSAFHQTFQRAMGMSYGEFCLRSRLALAAHALLGSDLGVGTIAEMTGFVDASHLHRRFREQYGFTPAEYRRRARAGEPVHASSKRQR
jgi:AraC-like DNA-binding protein